MRTAIEGSAKGLKCFCHVISFLKRGAMPKGGGGGILRISSSSDGDDRRILLGLKFSIPGFF